MEVASGAVGRRKPFTAFDFRFGGRSQICGTAVKSRHQFRNFLQNRTAGCTRCRRFIGRDNGKQLLEQIRRRLDSGAKRVTIHLPYDKGGALEALYREAKVEKVDYSATIDVVAVCTPRTIGQLKDYVEGYEPPKEPWED